MKIEYLFLAFGLACSEVSWFGHFGVTTEDLLVSI